MKGIGFQFWALPCMFFEENHLDPHGRVDAGDCYRNKEGGMGEDESTARWRRALEKAEEEEEEEEEAGEKRWPPGVRSALLHEMGSSGCMHMSGQSHPTHGETQARGRE